MRQLVMVLKLISPVFLVVAALHLILGLNADVLLGAKLSAVIIHEPSLSSQNRFYGVAFAFYGIVLYLCATDLERYAPIFKSLLCVFFLAGAARFVAWYEHGAPTLWVKLLLVSELALPPILYFWYLSARRN